MNWRDIPGHAGYQVSDTGQVRSTPGGKRWGRVLKPWTTNGYAVVRLGASSRCMVHRLVAMSFLPGDTSHQVNHINGDKLDNRLENLEWATCGENHRHAYQQLGRQPAMRKAVRIGLQQFPTQAAASRFLGVTERAVKLAIQKNHKCKGQEVAYV